MRGATDDLRGTTDDQNDEFINITSMMMNIESGGWGAIFSKNSCLQKNSTTVTRKERTISGN